MDVSWSIFGTSVHYILQKANEGYDNVNVERSFITNISGWDVSTTLDLIENGTYYDWKVTKAWAVTGGVKPEWEKQLNVGRYLAYCEGLRIHALKIVAILRDWNQLSAIRDHQYPKTEVVVLDAPVWPLEKSHSYIKHRLELHNAAFLVPDSDLPPCTPEERWAKPERFALHKTTKQGKPAQKAYRVYDSKEEAEATRAKMHTGTNYEIIRRKPESVRCERYCDVKNFCYQYQAQIKPELKAA